MLELHLRDMYDISESHELMQKIKKDVENLRNGTKLIKIAYMGMGHFGLLIKYGDFYHPVCMGGSNGYDAIKHRELFKNMIFENDPNKIDICDPDVMVRF